MLVLMIGTDRKIFEEGSDVRRRMIAYGGLVDELHIIVFATNKLQAKSQKLKANIWVYPTQSKNKWHYMRDAVDVGKRLPKPDLVTAQDASETGWSAYKLARHFNARLQLQVHGDIFSGAFKSESFLNSVRVHMAHRLLPKADCIRVVSERIKHELIATFGVHKRLPHITVLPIFVDGLEFEKEETGTELQDKYSQFEYRVLMVSRLEKEKNVRLGIDAFAKMLKGFPKGGLFIAGDGSMREELESYVSRKGLKDNVVFLGWQDDLVSLYKTTDVYLLTSNHEGYARTLIEAALAGTAIVTTAVGVAEYVLQDEESALICKPGDEKCLASHLERLATNTGLRLELSVNANRAVQGHLLGSNEEYLQEYKKLWETCGK